MALLKLQNIGKIYDSNDILTIGIRGINLELDYNEFVTVEGESGSGKSTLLNVIGANDSYEEGELYIHGEETSHYSESDWENYRARYIATVFQDFNIIENLTVLENVELALLRIEDKKERRERAESLIEKVGLTKQKNQKGSMLSGGEKQRTVIARALAKDAPIILADEPTGNLDVKASREVAKLLKEVSKDKLVIVVTHNPEFFVEYATRRIHIFDGGVQEDDIISRPNVTSDDSAREEFLSPTKKQNAKNTVHIGVLNYKSRPRFTIMMSMALFVCAIALFIVLSVFGQSLIRPVKGTLDEISVEGKVLLSAETDIDPESLDLAAASGKAGFVLLNKEYSEFVVTVSQKGNMLKDHDVNCLYAPYQYNLEYGEAVLIVPASFGRDSDAIVNTFLRANVGIENITVKTTLYSDEVCLYLSYGNVARDGAKIAGINSTVNLGDYDYDVYTFERNDELEDGTVILINSTSFEAEKNSAVFSVKAGKSYSVLSASEKRNDVDGLIVQMSANDYSEIFEDIEQSSSQSVLYFKDDQTARQAIAQLPEEFMGLLSTSSVYVHDAGNIYALNVLYYVALIAVCVLIAALISVIFGRSVKVYQTDFAVYKTLGISNKVSSRSLYVQMALIFLPTLVLLPIVSLIAAVIPGSSMAYITTGNYLFVELMMLLIVELVAFGFNKNISGQSIRKSLRRGLKG